MNFRPELAEAVIAGTKTVTRRLVSENPRSPWWRGGCSLKVGQLYAVCPGRGKVAIGHVRILRVETGQLLHLTRAEAALEGFPSVDAFEEAWRDINGRYDPQALVHEITMAVER